MDMFVQLIKQNEQRFPKSVAQWKNVTIESDANVPFAFRQPWTDFLSRVESMEEVATKAIAAEVAAKKKAKKLEARLHAAQAAKQVLDAETESEPQPSPSNSDDEAAPPVTSPPMTTEEMNGLCSQNPAIQAAVKLAALAAEKLQMNTLIIILPPYRPMMGSPSMNQARNRMWNH